MAIEIKRRENNCNLIDLNGVSPFLQAIYQHRGISNEAQLVRSLQALLPVNTLKDMQRACERLYLALMRNEQVLIIGDFDADGATSTAVAIRGLRMLGFSDVDYLVPNRFDFGYGLSPEIVDYAHQHKNPSLIITVDNGITNVTGVARARQYDIDVIVTDHHLAGDELPAAIAIVNPNQPGCHFASKNLAGVGVIFYVLMAFRAFLRDCEWFTENDLSVPNLAVLLDIVALGTVADVVQLDQNNRILVYQGIERIRRQMACPGISALLTVSNRNPQKVVASDLGFAVAPRLNAAGRLEDMSLGIECLITDDPTRALAIAQELHQLNAERQSLEQEMKEQATEILRAVQMDGELPLGIALYDDSWHQGVIGILASRIKEQYHRPVICFADGKAGEIKGSARSIPGCHIRDILAVIHSKHPRLMTKFGGHAMAAGLSMPTTHFLDFKNIFESTLKTSLSQDDLVAVLQSDGALPTDAMTLPTADLIRQAGPWGQGFPEPLFDDEFDVVDCRILSDKHLKLILQKDSVTFDAIAFNVLPTMQNQLPLVRVRAAYRLDINEFRGQSKLQLMLQHIMAIDG